MNKKEKYKRVNDLKVQSIIRQRRVCRCGHVVTLDRTRAIKNKKGYFVCNWCGGRIYYDPLRQLEHNAKCDKEEFRLYVIRYIKYGCKYNPKNKKKKWKKGYYKR